MQFEVRQNIKVAGVQQNQVNSTCLQNLCVINLYVLIARSFFTMLFGIRFSFVSNCFRAHMEDTCILMQSKVISICLRVMLLMLIPYSG